MNAATKTVPEYIRTYKVETTAIGVVLWINGKPYATQSGESIAFDLARCAQGHNPPPTERT